MRFRLAIRNPEDGHRLSQFPGQLRHRLRIACGFSDQRGVLLGHLAHLADRLVDPLDTVARCATR
jgi:hypothetical protein